jgi:phage terminase small subunit
MPENLTAKQRKCIEALLTKWDTTQAAAAAGVSRDTLYRWLKGPAFREELQNATRASLEALSRGLVTLGGQALDVLAATLDDPKANQAAKVRAADIILSKILSLRELIDLESRLSALEEVIKK